MRKLTIEDVQLENKKIIVRVDYNAPIDENGNITDDTRIVATLPTIKYLMERNCKIILISHLGRPKGKVDKKYSLRPVAKRLSELLSKEVKFVEDCIGGDVKSAVNELKSGEVILLENLRFHPEEEKNDLSFAKELASLGDIFVQDAFGTVHRAHASTVGIAQFLPAYCGFLLKKEIEYFAKVLENPARPFLAILGGAKVSDKIGVITNLLEKVDSLIIGGAMAYTFLKSQNISVGDSLCEEDKLNVAKEILLKATEKKVSIFLPIDHIIAKDITAESEIQQTSGVDIPDGWKGVDIGSMSILRFISIIRNAKTIVWNGPLGIFEIDKFSKGTTAIAQVVAEVTDKGAISVVGGGDTAAAVAKAGVSAHISHISTGGGASLEMLEGKELPGISVIKEG
jgi:triosephosphate isomerase